MANKSKPSLERMPFRTELGPKFGVGQDNVVFQMVHSAEKPHLRQPSGSVLKINHNNAAEHRIRLADDRKAAEAGIRYKKNKYDLLRAFLGDFIPKTSFVLGEVVEGKQPRYAEYTIQQEVPRTSLHQLTEQQRNDPRLRENMKDLLFGLQRMYRIMGEVNARTAQGITLDGKLDLGGVSKYVLSEDLDDGLRHRFSEEDVVNVIETNRSPNLLVDPESMQLYCIDFDQGQWYPGMDDAKEKALARLSLETRVAHSLGRVVTDSVTQLSLLNHLDEE